MTSKKIKRLVELMVAKEVKRLIPQIISELKNSSGQTLNETPERAFLRQVRSNKKPVQKTYSSNSMLNELLSSTQIPREDDVMFDFVPDKQTNKPLSTQQMISTFSGNPEAKVNLANENVQKTLDILNKDYSSVVKKMNNSPRPQVQLSQEEDLSWLDEIG
jgi:hypothetical protein